MNTYLGAIAAIFCELYSVPGLTCHIFIFFLKMVLPKQHSQRLEGIFLCTTQATPTGQYYDIFVVVYTLRNFLLRQQTLKTPVK